MQGEEDTSVMQMGNRLHQKPVGDWLTPSANERGSLLHLRKTLPLYTSAGKKRIRIVMIIWLPHVSKGVVYKFTFLFMYSLNEAILACTFVHVHTGRIIF